MRISVVTCLLLLAALCSIFGGVAMGANNTTISTNTTTLSTIISTTKAPGSATGNPSSNVQGSGLTGSGAACNNGTSTTSGVLSTSFPSSHGTVLILLTVSIFFSMALLMK